MSGFYKICSRILKNKLLLPVFGEKVVTKPLKSKKLEHITAAECIMEKMEDAEHGGEE